VSNYQSGAVLFSAGAIEGHFEGKTLQDTFREEFCEG